MPPNDDEDARLLMKTSRSLLRTLLCALSGVLLTACQPGPPAAGTPPPDAVALLDGQPLERALLDLLERQHTGSRKSADAPVAASAASAVSITRQQLLEELVAIEVLARKARERGLDKQPALQAEAELQAKTVLAHAVVREQIANISVTEAELAAAYEEQVPPHEFKTAHILVPTREQAQTVLDQLQQGRPFAELARRHSTDTETAAQGGSIGWRMVEQLPPQLAKAVRHLKPGQPATEAVQTAAGWHIVQSQGVRLRAERPTLQAAKEWLHPQLVDVKVQAEQQQWRRDATIELSRTPAAASEPSLPAGAVAVVNKRSLASTLLDELLRARQADGSPPQTLDRRRILDDLVTMELLAQRAHSTGLAARPEVRAEVALSQKMLLGQQLLKRMTEEMQIDEAELQARYRALPIDVEIEASHILVKEEALARQLIAQLKQGASFAELARKHTLDTDTRPIGGNLGRVLAQELLPPLAAAVQTLKPGQTALDPVRTDVGWHVVRLSSSRTLPKKTYEVMKPKLRTPLVKEKLDAQIAQWRKEAKVTVLGTP
jgi:peptidyl-prolyl cis-trans isomerase C